MGLALIIGAAITGRLFCLQILQGKFFEAQALGQQVKSAESTGSRGQIFCASSQEARGQAGSGEIKTLAINKEDWAVSAKISDIDDRQAFAGALADKIGMTEQELILKLQSGGDYVMLKKDLSREQADKIKALNIKGLVWQSTLVRVYPQGELASQIIGFLGGEDIGQYGVEGYYEDVLRGKTGIAGENRSSFDYLFGTAPQRSLDGSDIYLTIDYNIQFEAESLLKKTSQNLDIESGQIIVIKPDSGRILALANYPAFDPNQYSKAKDMSIFQNSATQKLFEPGSIMKPFTMAAALNEGKITPDTTYVDTGIVKFGTKSIHNFANEVYGSQTMTQVLENSINTGAVYAQELLSHKTFLGYLDRFGFGQKTGVDLQGEIYSSNSALRNNGPDMNFATASFGQGVELTPIQIVRGFCAIANGGKLVKPYIVEKVVIGGEESLVKPEISSPVVSQQTISQLTTMLISVVDNGFNSVAKIPGYYLAGKTGTAQVPLSNAKGYDENKTIQSFVGFGPAFNSQFLIMVKLDNPKVPKSSLSAVPVFKELAQYIINYWQIPPDYDIDKK